MSDSLLGETSGNLEIHLAAKSTASFNLVIAKFYLTSHSEITILSMQHTSSCFACTSPRSSSEFVLTALAEDDPSCKHHNSLNLKNWSQTGFKTQFCLLLTAWHWASCLSSLNFIYLIYKIIIISHFFEVGVKWVNVG